MTPAEEWIDRAESALAKASQARSWNDLPEQVTLDLLYSVACSLLALATSQRENEGARRP